MNFNYFWCYLSLLLNSFSLPFYSDSCDVFVQFVTYLQCLVCKNDGGGSASLLNNMYSERWHCRKEIQMKKKRIWGFEDIQADTNTQQQGAEVDTDTMQNSSSSQKKTINTQKTKEKRRHKTGSTSYFFCWIRETTQRRSQKHKTRRTRVILNRRYAQLEQQWKVVGGKKIQMSIL